MEQLVTYLARALVDEPDQVSLSVSEGEGGRLYELRVAPQDVGKVIGRDGRTVSALRTLVGVAAAKQGLQKVRLEIADDRRTAAQQGPAPAGSETAGSDPGAP